VRRLCRIAGALTFGAFETARENSHAIENDTVTPSPMAEQSSQWHSWHGLLRTRSARSAIDFIHASNYNSTIWMTPVFEKLL
jgi:hypothetical protein